MSVYYKLKQTNMKKILIIIAAVLIGCNPDPTPQPLPTPIPSGSTTATSYNFVGNWDCYDWVVDEIMGTTHHRRFIFSNQLDSTVNISLNDYNSSGTLNQMFTMKIAKFDSSYFNHDNNALQINFKGVLTTDTTLMVYQYENTSGVIDTVQSKLFIKE